MPSKLKIGLAQFQSKPLAVEDNYATAEGYIRSAAAQACHIVLLPEYHLTSWVSEQPAAFREASRRSEAYVARYQDLARELGISIVAGTINYLPQEEQSHPGHAKMRNVAHFIAAHTGEIRGTYQKRNLWHTERADLTSGRAPHQSFDTGLTRDDGSPIRAGMLICWDLASPEPFRHLAADGADLVLIPSYWFLADAGPAGLAVNPDAERVFLESAVTLRAFESTAAVAFCNAGGFSGVGMPFIGRRGADDEKDGLHVVDVDLDVLSKAEDNYRVRADLASDEWRYS